jgi:hypothetical protein
MEMRKFGFNHLFDTCAFVVPIPMQRSVAAGLARADASTSHSSAESVSRAVLHSCVGPGVEPRQVKLCLVSCLKRAADW